MIYYIDHHHTSSFLHELVLLHSQNAVHYLVLVQVFYRTHCAVVVVVFHQGSSQTAAEIVLLDEALLKGTLSGEKFLG